MNEMFNNSGNMLNNKIDLKKPKSNISSENKEEHLMEVTSVKTNTHGSQALLVGSRGANTNVNCPKMGSRRIFTPQFKLQVLESYRNDNDCKGNQRATARKYNIHRRQIQKWLQCESSLRTSVANISHSSVKHQFHNVNMQQQSQKQLIASNSTVNSLHSSGQVQQSHHCIDSSRPVTLNNTIVPSLPTGVNSSCNQRTQDVFEISNLTAVVATRVNPGSVTITNTSSTYVSEPITSDIPDVCRNANSSIAPSLRQYQHYTITPYSNIQTPIVPILTQRHVHQHIVKPRQSSPYQYHNIVYTSPSNHQPEQQPSSYFIPINVPNSIDVLSTPTTISSSFATKDIEGLDRNNTTQTLNKAYTKALSENNTFAYDDKQLLYNNEYTESGGSVTDSSNMNLQLTLNQFKNDTLYPTAFSFAPMDLSLHHRRDIETALNTSNKPVLHNADIKQHSEMYAGKIWNDGIEVVDLTYRKRKVLNHTFNTDNSHKIDFPKKILKLTNSENNQSTPFTLENIDVVTNPSGSNDDDDIEIEVGIEEKFPPSKPIKLFKPYLLDDCENDGNSKCCTKKCTKNHQRDLIEKNSTISCTSSALPSKCTDACNENTFPVSVSENTTTYTDNSNFLIEIENASPRSAFSPAISVPTLSPINFQYPKGSPASSGYESSTSSYSDSSLCSRSEIHGYGQAYSINLQMQSIYNETMYPSKNVQSWLDKDSSKPFKSNSSIALLV